MKAVASLALSLLLAVEIRAQPPRPAFSENELKAAFLLNFTKFISWPETAFAGPQSPLIIGVLGDEAFGSVLATTLEGESVRGRALVMRRLEVSGSLRSCHVLYIGASHKSRLRTILASLEGAPVLTVAEMDEFTRIGGMVNFRLKDNRLRFEINKTSADKAGLKLEAQLLALALAVAMR